MLIGDVMVALEERTLKLVLGLQDYGTPAWNSKFYSDTQEMIIDKVPEREGTWVLIAYPDKKGEPQGILKEIDMFEMEKTREIISEYIKVNKLDRAFFCEVNVRFDEKAKAIRFETGSLRMTAAGKEEWETAEELAKLKAGSPSVIRSAIYATEISPHASVDWVKKAEDELLKREYLIVPYVLNDIGYVSALWIPVKNQKVISETQAAMEKQAPGLKVVGSPKVYGFTKEGILAEKPPIEEKRKIIQ